VVEKTDDNGAMMHVWRLVLASEGDGIVGKLFNSQGRFKITKVFFWIIKAA